MRVCVVIPGEEFLSAAGVRIRYQRLAPHLQAHGHDLDLRLIDDVSLLSEPDFDLLLISKCYDARGLALAAYMKSRGIPVGADFFDDYYSQREDSRFVHLRRWLGDIAKSLSFALCSTSLMQQNLSALLPSLPSHLMNDPYETLDAEGVSQAVEAKFERVLSTREIDIGWFGIGDNPYFPVGISDLEAAAGTLAGFRQHGLTPNLTIITNRRALGVDRLEALARIPIPWRLEEWSEEAEKTLISESHCCFLPVNAQRFSIVKSLNRAVTALTAGSQVLSAGYPLYDVFGSFVYRSASGLAADLLDGAPKLRRDTADSFVHLMSEMADPAREAQGLSDFLAAIPGAPDSTEPFNIAVVHGRTPIAAIHKFIQRNGHLSVGGARAGSELNYDIRPFRDPQDGVASVQISPTAQKLLRPELAAELRPVTLPNGRKAFVLPLPHHLESAADALTAGMPESDAAAIAAYATEVHLLRRLIDYLFTAVTPILSEPYSPFWEGSGPQRQAA